MTYAHKLFIRRVALGHVELRLDGTGQARFIGGDRQMAEEMRRAGIVETMRKSPQSWLFVLTDAGRWLLGQCFERPEDGNVARCRHCGRAFPADGRRRYCGHCGNPRALSAMYYRRKIMEDDAKHEKKIEGHRKWREWAKANDPEYRARKAEAQRRWRQKQACLRV